MKTEDVQLKDFAVDYMRNVTKTFGYTENVLARLDQEAMAEIAMFGVPNPLLNALLKKLAV
jgi:geranylgeranyl diphosphate synthase type 3